MKGLCAGRFSGRTDTLQLRPDLHSSRMDAAEGPVRLEKDVCLLLVTGRDQLKLWCFSTRTSPDLSCTACEVLVQSHEWAGFP